MDLNVQLVPVIEFVEVITRPTEPNVSVAPDAPDAALWMSSIE